MFISFLIPSRRCWKLFFAPLLVMPLLADVATVQGSFFTGPAEDSLYGPGEAGVDFAAYNDGLGWNYDYSLTQFFDVGGWNAGGYPISSPILPAGSTVNSATFSIDLINGQIPYTNASIWPYSGFSGPALVTVETSYMLQLLSVYELPDYIDAESSGLTISFIPSSPNFTITPYISGEVNIAITDLMFPQCPASSASPQCGFEFTDIAYGPEIDYTLTVNYTPAPEPAFWPVLTILLLAVFCARWIPAAGKLRLSEIA